MSKANIKRAQQILMSSGFSLPRFGADGDFGNETMAAFMSAMEDLASLRGHLLPDDPSTPPAGLPVPDEWLPSVKMARIVFHWTAGANKASEFDRKHYHVLIEGDGNIVRGIPSIAANVAPVKQGYAAHTASLNSGSIGVSLCGMRQARESPFDPGPSPITQVQVEKLAAVLAQLCVKYSIPVRRDTVLSHAEVQPTLGVKQANKWDISRLPFDLSVKGPVVIGDKIRAQVLSYL